jgi:hypothetical protein
MNAGKDKFVVRGRVGNWDCEIACTRPQDAEIRFNLGRVFSPRPNAAGATHLRNSSISGYNAARYIIAHEFVHNLIYFLGSERIESAYRDTRRWRLEPINPSTLDLEWTSAIDGGTVLSTQYTPEHSLVAVIGLYIAGGNTWVLAKPTVTPADRDFVEGFRWAYFSDYFFWYSTGR